MDFPPILRRRKLRTGERKPIAQVLQLRWAPTSSGGEGLPVTFPAGAWVGGPACPIPPGLALSPRPPPSPGRAAAAAGRQVTPAQARRVGQRGIAPASSQDPPERPLPGLALVVGGGQEGRDPPLRVEDGPGVWAGLAMPPTLLGGGAQAGSGGWAGAETLARPSSCRRNSELAGGWLPGTSGAAPWPPAPGRPRLLGSGPLSRLLRTDAETSGEPWAKPQTQLRSQALARPGPPGQVCPGKSSGPAPELCPPRLTHVGPWGPAQGSRGNGGGLQGDWDHPVLGCQGSWPPPGPCAPLQSPLTAALRSF